MSTKQTAVVGLTGGIASGKSTITRMFRDRGVTVLDADQIAREIVEPGTPALQEIAEHFGGHVLLPSGELNRAALGALVFGDDGSRRELERITHPRIGQRTAELVQQATRDGIPWLLYDAALLVENGLQNGLDGLIVVSCSALTQLRRIVARDRLSLEEAKARIDAQLPLSEKTALADWVIDNDGALAHTEKQVESVFEQLTRQFGELHDEQEE